ncbi:phage head morphogenesis protein [Vibrio parahaemolyticus]|nr:phage head morphogenesis protein [Vibrio parahaemolyticus]
MTKSKKAKPAILPRSIEDPTSVDKLERGAIRKFTAKLKKIGIEYSKLVDQFRPSLAVNQRYVYELDEYTLQSVLQQGVALIEDILIDGSQSSFWFFNDYVEVAYERGTFQEFTNLSHQSAAYEAGQESARSILDSEPYRRRIALINARVFEEMKGLTAEVKANMTRVLTDGLARGLNPLEIARTLKATTSLSQSRANRIARTEITTALRRARLDESDDARDRFGLKSLMMQISALSPTTRKWHAERHGQLFTSDEVREWLATDANSINCKCVFISVLVDDDGNPLNPIIQERAQKMLQKSQFATNQKCTCC